MMGYSYTFIQSCGIIIKLLRKMFYLFPFFIASKPNNDETNKSNVIFEGRKIKWGNSAFIEKILSNIRLTTLSFLNIFSNEFYLGITKKARKIRKLQESFYACLSWIMEERKKCKMEDVDGNEYYTDFLMRRKEQHNLKEKKILKELADFVTAGSDTSSTTIASLILFIAMHPEIQEGLFKEQQEIFGESDRDPTIEDLEKMKYLERVIKETLRFTSPPGVIKFTDEACVIGSQEVPKAYLIFVYLRKLHHNPKYFEKPDVFFPDRFLPEVEAKRPPNTFFPFGVGARKCPGFFYANILMKVMVSMMVRAFTFKTPITRETINYVYIFLLVVNGGYLVEFNLRKK